MDSAAAASGVKGVSVAVLVPGQGLWTGVSGISSPGVPVTSDMRFGFASNTKLFIAVAMEKLQEQGVLSLDDHLSKWLPSFPNVDSNTTIRQLLSHQSGIFDFWNDNANAYENSILSDTARFWTPQEVLATIGKPHFAPGLGFSYSNTNYLLAGMVIEAATGKSWTQKLHDIIFDPLKMDSTFVGAFESPNGPVAHEWIAGYGEIKNSPMTSAYSSVNASGAILSTPQEMAEWYSALFSGAIISDSSLKEALDFDPTSQYGLGISESVVNKNHYSYLNGGLMFGYFSQMIYDVKTKSVFSLVTNCRDIDLGILGDPLLNVWYNEFPMKVNDAGITSIESPWENSCTATVIPTVTLTNFGTASLTSVTINYKNDNDAATIFHWTGSLNPGDTIPVILPQIAAGDGYHKFTCYTSNPNNIPEGYTFNDTLRSNFIINTSPSVISRLNENFEGGVFPPVGWTENSSSMFQWGHTFLAGYNGSGSAVKSSYDGEKGSFTDLNLPLLTFLGSSSINFSFDYAYEWNPSNIGDSLQVLISDDCSTSWKKMFNKGGSSLATTGLSSSFYPQSRGQWRHASFTFPSFTGDVLIRFRVISGSGNRLYLDNVIVDPVTGTSENLSFTADNVFPNPFNKETTFAYTLTESTKVSLQIYDGFGRQVAEPVNAFEIGGEHRITWDAGNLPAGIYYSRLNAGKQVMKRKIIKIN